MLLHVAVNVHLPKDRVSGNHQCFGFVEFMSEDDAEYAIKVLNMIIGVMFHHKAFRNTHAFREFFRPALIFSRTKI